MCEIASKCTVDGGDFMSSFRCEDACVCKLESWKDKRRRKGGNLCLCILLI